MNDSAAAAASSPDAVLVLEGLTKRYREGGGRVRTVLDAVDLTIDRGAQIALLGRSGSGKSTLLNLLCGIDQPDDGRVLLDGVDLAALDERARTLLRRTRIGFIFQFFNLIPTLTVAENLLLPLELAGRTDAALRARALERLAFVGLDDRAGDFPDVLSGGEQQRVAIARALAHEPDVLLADEPTGNLDADTEAQVLTLLGEAVAASGTTLIMATHSREVAARVADRTLMMQAGRPIDQPLAGAA
ncbi:MAG: ABC transporter ATP-binding protein [Acidobacteriota bacterium]